MKKTKTWHKISQKKLDEAKTNLSSLEKEYGLKRNTLHSVKNGRKKISNDSTYFDILKPYLRRLKRGKISQKKLDEAGVTIRRIEIKHGIERGILQDMKLRRIIIDEENPYFAILEKYLEN